MSCRGRRSNFRPSDYDAEMLTQSYGGFAIIIYSVSLSNDTNFYTWSKYRSQLKQISDNYYDVSFVFRKTSKKLRILSEKSDPNAQSDENAQLAVDEDEALTLDEHRALKAYEAMKSKKRKAPTEDQSDDEDEKIEVDRKSVV